MTLDYKLLEALTKVIERGSFEGAAQALFITQSAVSQRIKLLEEQAGEILLQRTTPPLPTPQGEKYLIHFNKIAHLEEDFLRQKSDSDTTFANLSISVNADSMATWFSSVLSPFLQKNKVVLNLKVADQDKTHTLLQNGTVLASIGTYEKPIQGCSTHYLGSEHYDLYCSENFYDNYFHEGFSINTADKAPVIHFNQDDELNTLLFQKNFISVIHPNFSHQFYVPSTELFSDFILKGIAFGALPHTTAANLSHQGINLIRLSKKHIEVKLYFHVWNMKSVLLQNFTDYMVTTSKKYLRP